ncbi:hypothetical protein [Rosistilla oblonga]|nr:hypothetical protein [Rosistilla oblonga]
MAQDREIGAMRLWLGLVIAVFTLVLANVSPGSGAGETQTKPEASRPALVAGAGELLGFVNPQANDGQQITIVNATRGTMLVYHIDGPTGQITLKSSRRLTWDFSLDEYNATAPLPTEIRQMVER